MAGTSPIGPKTAGLVTPGEAPAAETTIGILGDCCGDCGGCTSATCGPCTLVAPGAPYYCVQQVILNLIPDEYVAWYNDTVDYVAAHGSCDGAPAEPATFDWATTIATATAILTGFDWDHPPLTWSTSQFVSGGTHYCPAVLVLRYLLAPIDEAGHIGYIWDNSDHPAGDGFVSELCAFTGVFSGLFWFGGPFATPCATPVHGGILSASACRFRGIASLCESLITQNFTEDVPGSGAAICDTRTLHSCGLITAAEGECLYAGGGGPGFSGFGGLSPGDPGDDPNVTPAVGWVTWTFAPCTDCDCP